ncbi:MAG: SUMF1/EgtB/PvdO family nonheme iron enzyme [Oscillospiraceae bacterium]|jgi:hypothetical protein|nr:SUMF1/EgtB/PvdO family nonheme iron enzyme [Oscillospiraceae bacterium]
MELYSNNGGGTLELSVFLQTLHNSIGGRKSTAKFTAELFDNFVSETCDVPDIKENTFGKYYNGSVVPGKPIIRDFLKYYDGERFVAYLTENVNENTRDELATSFEEYQQDIDFCVSVSDVNIKTFCISVSNQLETILKNILPKTVINSTDSINVDISSDYKIEYLNNSIKIWERQLSDKVNIRNIKLGGNEYVHFEESSETSDDVTDIVDEYNEVRVHEVKMHYQFGTSPAYTDNVCECVESNIKKIVLLGEPGSGKSVALLKIAIAYAKKAVISDNAFIPVLIPLGSYKGDIDFVEFVGHCLNPLTNILKDAQLFLNTIIIFDGLNETTNDKKTTVINYIKRLNKFVVSCRILDYEQSFSNIKGVSTIEILPLDPIRIRDAVDNKLWTKLDGNDFVINAWNNIVNKNDKAEDSFWDQTHNVELPPKEFDAYRTMINRGIMPLCRNPLMLSIAYGLQSNNRLPDTRGELIKEFVIKCTNDELKNRKYTSEKSAKLIDTMSSVLMVTAKTIQEKRIGTESLKTDDIREILPDLDIQQIDTVIDFAKSAGILSKNNSERNSIRFYHQLFQEYYASLFLYDIIIRGVDFNASLLFDENEWWKLSGWEETFVLLSESINKPQYRILIQWLAQYQPLLTVRCINNNNCDLSEDVIEGIRYLWKKRIEEEARNFERHYSVAQIAVALSKIGDTRKGVSLKVSKLPDIDWRDVFELSLCVSRFPVTCEQYNAFILDGGYERSNGFWDDSDEVIEKKDTIRICSNFPVVNITWYEARAFCKWLTLKTGYKIRLPYSYEWKDIYNRCNFDRSLQFFNTSSKNTDNHLVSCGIYAISNDTIAEDLIGNIWEWCNDEKESAEDYDPFLEDIKPSSTRVLKGGSWRCDIAYSNPEYNLFAFPQCSRSDIGFRIVRDF